MPMAARLWRSTRTLTLTAFDPHQPSTTKANACNKTNLKNRKEPSREDFRSKSKVPKTVLFSTRFLVTMETKIRSKKSWRRTSRLRRRWMSKSLTLAKTYRRIQVTSLVSHQCQRSRSHTPAQGRPRYARSILASRWTLRLVRSSVKRERWSLNWSKLSKPKRRSWTSKSNWTYLSMLLSWNKKISRININASFRGSLTFSRSRIRRACEITMWYWSSSTSPRGGSSSSRMTEIGCTPPLITWWWSWTTRGGSSTTEAASTTICSRRLVRL